VPGGEGGPFRDVAPEDADALPRGAPKVAAERAHKMGNSGFVSRKWNCQFDQILPRVVSELTESPCFFGARASGGKRTLILYPEVDMSVHKRNRLGLWL
jgi:hypothetical protein